MNVWIWKIAPTLQFSIQDKFNQNSSKPRFQMEKYNLKHIKEIERKHYLTCGCIRFLLFILLTTTGDFTQVILLLCDMVSFCEMSMLVL